MQIIDNLKLWAGRVGRKPSEPKRDTLPYPSMSVGGVLLNKTGGISRYTPENLRVFSRTPYVRCAINAIKQPLIQLDWEIKPIKDAKNSRELKKQIEVATNCFKHPNNQLSFRKLFELSIEDYLTYGSAAIEQQLGNNAIRPLWFYPVDTRSIQVYPGWNGAQNEARYVQTLGYSNILDAGSKNLRDDELIYITANESNEAPFGWGAVQIAYMTIARLLGVEDFAGKLASNMYPSFMFLLSNYTDQEIAAFSNRWRNEIEGNGGIPAFGVPKTQGQQKTFEKLDLNDHKKDPFSLQWQEFLIRSISAAFNLSPQNLNLERDVNRNTSEVAEDRDWDRTINPMARTFEQAFTNHTLHKKLGFAQLEFKFIGLDRADELNTAKIFEIDYQNNSTIPNEYRALKGLQPLDNFWANMTYADAQIAMKAANETKVVDDPNLKTNPAAQIPAAPATPANSDLSQTMVSDKDKQDLKNTK
jgi:hypothetical protein